MNVISFLLLLLLKYFHLNRIGSLPILSKISSIELPNLIRLDDIDRLFGKTSIFGRPFCLK